MVVHSRIFPSPATLMLAFAIAACGGQTLVDGDVGNASAQGGATATGGRAGTVVGNAGANKGGAVGFGGNCAAAPRCNVGDYEMYSGNCPADSTCYYRDVCTALFMCRHIVSDAGFGSQPVGSGGQCNVYPTCPIGDSRITGSCPAGFICYAQFTCGPTIICGFPINDAGVDDAGAGDDAATCNPNIEYNRDYMALSPSACMSVRYTCGTDMTYFNNACGCGCQQDSSCPAYVNCMPGSGTSPLCTSSRCPLSIRVQ